MSAATSLTTIENIIAVTRNDPNPIPLFPDIVTAKNLHGLIMKSIRPNQDRVFKHFLMTPIDIIDKGRYLCISINTVCKCSP